MNTVETWSMILAICTSTCGLIAAIVNLAKWQDARWGRRSLIFAAMITMLAGTSSAILSWVKGKEDAAEKSQIEQERRSEVQKDEAERQTLISTTNQLIHYYSTNASTPEQRRLFQELLNETRGRGEIKPANDAMTARIDPRLELATKARDLAEKIQGVWEHFSTAHTQIVKEKMRWRNQMTQDEWNAHELPFLNMEVDRKRAETVATYKRDYMPEAIELRKMIKHELPSYVEDPSYLDSSGDYVFGNPIAVQLQDIAEDLRGMANALDERITSHPAK